MVHQDIKDLVKFGSDGRGDVFQRIMLNKAHVLWTNFCHVLFLFDILGAQQHLSLFTWTEKKQQECAALTKPFPNNWSIRWQNSSIILRHMVGVNLCWIVDVTHVFIFIFYTHETCVSSERANNFLRRLPVRNTQTQGLVKQYSF